MSNPEININQDSTGNTQNNTFNYDKIVEDAKQEGNLEGKQTGLENVTAGNDINTNISQEIHHEPRKLADKIGMVVNKTIIQNLHLDSKNIFAIALSFGFVVIGLLSIFEYIRSKNFYQPVVNSPEVKPTQQDKAQEVYLRAKDKLIKKNVKGGIQDLTSVIQLNPKYTAAYIDRGLARRQLQDHGGAIQDFTTAISINPNNFDAYNNRCVEYRLLAQKTKQVPIDKLNTAKKDCDSAIFLSESKIANPFFNRAVIFAMLGEIKRAISDFEYAKQISLGIQNDWDLYNLAENEIKKIKLIEEEIDKRIKEETEKIKQPEMEKCLEDPSFPNCYDPPKSDVVPMIEGEKYKKCLKDQYCYDLRFWLNVDDGGALHK